MNDVNNGLNGAAVQTNGENAASRLDRYSYGTVSERDIFLFEVWLGRFRADISAAEQGQTMNNDNANGRRTEVMDSTEKTNGPSGTPQPGEQPPANAAPPQDAAAENKLEERLAPLLERMAKTIIGGVESLMTTKITDVFGVIRDQIKAVAESVIKNNSEGEKRSDEILHAMHTMMGNFQEAHEKNTNTSLATAKILKDLQDKIDKPAPAPAAGTSAAAPGGQAPATEAGHTSQIPPARPAPTETHLHEHNEPAPKWWEAALGIVAVLVLLCIFLGFLYAWDHSRQPQPLPPTAPTPPGANASADNGAWRASVMALNDNVNALRKEQFELAMRSQAPPPPPAPVNVTVTNVVVVENQAQAPALQFRQESYTPYCDQRYVEPEWVYYRSYMPLYSPGWPSYSVGFRFGNDGGYRYRDRDDWHGAAIRIGDRDDHHIRYGDYIGHRR